MNRTLLVFGLCGLLVASSERPLRAQFLPRAELYNTVLGLVFPDLAPALEGVSIQYRKPTEFR